MTAQHGWFVGLNGSTVASVPDQDVTETGEAIIRPTEGESAATLAFLAEYGTPQPDGSYLLPGAYYVDPFSG